MGKAKTRLAADIGRVHAWRLYRAMTARILRNVTSPKWDTLLAVTPRRSVESVPLWEGFDQYPQVSGSLSPRLAQAFAAKGKIIVIGSDCPQITRADIVSGFDAIKPGQAEFGPADDGGFWLMGAMGPVTPDKFNNIRWSSRHTLKDISRNFGRPPKLLRTLIDVDDLAALKAVRQT